MPSCFGHGGSVVLYQRPSRPIWNNREEEDDEEVQRENWNLPFTHQTLHHFCICFCWEGSGSTDFLLPAEVGVATAVWYSIVTVLTQNPLRKIRTAERQEAWPRLDNSGGDYFWKQRAERRQGGVCSVSCWLFCQMWTAECVFMCQTELFVLWGRHTKSMTKKPPHRLRDDFRCVSLRLKNLNPF